MINKEDDEGYWFISDVFPTLHIKTNRPNKSQTIAKGDSQNLGTQTEGSKVTRRDQDGGREQGGGIPYPLSPRTITLSKVRLLVDMAEDGFA